MSNGQDTNYDDVLERAIDSVMNELIPAEPPRSRVRELAAKVKQTAEEPCPVTLVERTKDMMTPTKLAIAASVLVVLAGLMSWLSPNQGAVMAFDDVVEALLNVQSASWKKTTAVKGLDGKTTRFTGIGMYLAPSHERTETVAGEAKSAVIVDGRKDHALVLDVTEKTATVLKFENLPAQSPFGRSFQDLRKLIIDAQSGDSDSFERLGIDLVDGRRVGGFRVRRGSIAITLWADPKTSLPVRVEYATTTEPKVREVLTDFQINVNLEESLFSLEVPTGFTEERQTVDLATRPVDHLVAALRYTAEHNDDMFPDELRGKVGIDGVLQRSTNIAQGKTPAERRKMIMEVAGKLGSAFAVLLSLSPEHDLHYVGKDVKLDAPNKPILWFRVRPKETSNYYVVYADLTIKELSPEDAPREPTDD